MYGTLGAGFCGMLAFCSFFGGGAGAVALALDSRWITFSIVAAATIIATLFFSKLENDHWKALEKAFRQPAEQPYRE